MVNKGLGKGFDVLIPTDFDSNLLVDSSDRIQNVFIKDVVPNPDQPRKVFDEAALQELAKSIERHGVIQPIIVSPSAAGKYILVAGERRWRASQLAGKDQIPAIVRERKELEQLEIALIENVQRVDLTPLDQAISVERLHQQFNLSYKSIAERLGKAETTVSNIVRLLQLPEVARNALQNGNINEGHARAILALKTRPELQEQLLNLITSNGWSVRQAEQFVTSHKDGAKTDADVKKRLEKETPETKQLGAKLKTNVTLRRTARGGRLEIHFKNDEDLSALLSRFDVL